jgi:hypothetical protein
MVVRLAQRFHHWIELQGEWNSSSQQRLVEQGARRLARRKHGAPTMPLEVDVGLARQVTEELLWPPIQETDLKARLT